MRILALYLGVFVLLCADFAQNNGSMTKGTLRFVREGLRSIGLF
jgi:hypothetical protein